MTINTGRAVQQIKRSAVAANTTIAVPDGYSLHAITGRNGNANAVTGGFKVGTSSGAVDVVVAQAVGASANFHVPEASILVKRFPDTTTLFVQTVTSWNGAAVDIMFTFLKAT